MENVFQNVIKQKKRFIMNKTKTKDNCKRIKKNPKSKKKYNNEIKNENGNKL